MRTAGRYNLRQLGWKSFEDLGHQILRVVLGETVIAAAPGGDGGRDAFYQGVASERFRAQFGDGRFVVQFKHTSAKDGSLSVSTIEPELPKLAKLGRDGPFRYVLITNRTMSMPTERDVRSRLESTPGIVSVTVLDETWIEHTIDSEPRLLRLVPRLYGIGDLTQILSFGLEQQSLALFDALRQSLAVFVPTQSYRDAERLLTERGMVVLVGAPASGKSTIAANMCAVFSAQQGFRALKLDQPDHFVRAWSPQDPRTIYWVDDIFGETTLDDVLLRSWSSCLTRIDAAVRSGAKVVVSTRDYILRAAEQRLKDDKVRLLRDASVRVNVDNLQHAERSQILYNHVKHGDLTPEQKGRLKQFLPTIAALPSFTPELARRLGTARFHENLQYTTPSLREFFDSPVHFFIDAMGALAPKELAALAVCLLGNNRVPDPVPESALPQSVRDAYQVGLGDVRQAMEILEGSFTRRDVSAAGQTWRLHHPSMIDALRVRLASSSQFLEIYLSGADVDVLLRDTTTRAGTEGVFVPESMYDLLIRRLQRATHFDRFVEYLISKSSDALLSFLQPSLQDVLAAACSGDVYPGGRDIALEFAVRLSEAGLLTDGLRSKVCERLEAAFFETGAVGFLATPGSSLVLSHERVLELLRDDHANGNPSIQRMVEWLTEDSSAENLGYALSVLQEYKRDILPGLMGIGCVDPALVDDLNAECERIAEQLEEQESEPDYDDYDDDWDRRPAAFSGSIFSDVDE